jgi:NDP-sugar pyrophosphorylase family protein
MIQNYISRYASLFANNKRELPWQLITDLESIVQEMLAGLGNDYEIENDVAIHQTAAIEQNVVIKGPAIICRNCFIGANAYLRGPVIFDEEVKIGAGCEIKHSVIFSHTAIAHFNYVGNSVVGSRVNFEAGSVAANHYNERENKNISVLLEGKLVNTSVTKFGSLVGDDSKIGANAVLSPGTILSRGTVVGRLQLVQQVTGS